MSTPLPANLTAHPDRRRLLIVGEDAGIDSAFEIAEALVARSEGRRALVLLGSNATFPFRPRPSTILVPGIPAGAIACDPRLDEIGIASRLASTAGYPGCFDGSVLDLAAIWLATLEASAHREVEIFACGSAEFLTRAATIAQRFSVPLQQ